MPPRGSGVRVSTTDVNTLDQEPAKVGTAPVAAEPDEYPIDIVEWQAGMPAYYRTHIAGYRNEVRKAGELTVKKMRAVWDHGFKVFCGEATPEDAPKV